MKMKIKKMNGKKLAVNAAKGLIVAKYVAGGALKKLAVFDMKNILKSAYNTAKAFHDIKRDLKYMTGPGAVKTYLINKALKKVTSLSEINALKRMRKKEFWIK